MMIDSLKFDGIQIGRAVAALSVLYFHSWTALVRFPAEAASPIWPLSRVGELGVDLFFAVSGFVICMIATKPSFTPLAFLAKRALRIYPLWLTCLLTFAVLAAIWRGWQGHETFGYLLYSVTLLPTQELPFYNIGWTLQHEMAFYVLVAAVLPLVGLYGILAALILSFALLRDAPWFISNLSAFHLEFAAGMLAFLLLKKLRWFGSALPLAIGLVSLAVLFNYFGRTYLAPSLFLTTVGFANLHARGLFSKALVALGDQSYSIYLIHPIVFWSASAVSSKLTSVIPLWGLEPLRFACIAVVILISRVSFLYIEKPYLSFRRPAETPA